MITKVERYQTSDGEEFSTEKQAIAYEFQKRLSTILEEMTYLKGYAEEPEGFMKIVNLENSLHDLICEYHDVLAGCE